MDIKMKNELVRKSIIFLITTLFAAINIIPSSSMEINKDFIVFTNKQRYSALDFDQNITDLMKQIGEIQSAGDIEKIMELQAVITNLKKVEKELSRKLGKRAVTS